MCRMFWRWPATPSEQVALGGFGAIPWGPHRSVRNARDRVYSSPVSKVLVSNNSELLRHFTAPPFLRLGLELLVARSSDEARELFRKEQPALVVIDAEPSGFEAARAIKAHNP